MKNTKDNIRPTIQRQFDPNYHNIQGEVNTLPSETIPDMSIGIKQLLINHTRGINTDIKNYESMYDMDVPQLDDITDLEKFKYDNKIKQDKLKAKVQNEKRLQERANSANSTNNDPVDPINPPID